MKFFLKYTSSNVKNNKMRAILLSFCIAFASFLFMLSMIFPIYLRNYQESIMRSFFGNSDINIRVSKSSTSILSTLDDIPTEVSSNFEYCYGFIAMPSSWKDQSITLIAGYFDQLQDFNPVDVVKGDVSNFTGKKCVITETCAEKFGWSIGETVVFTYAAGLRGIFTVSAIVKNQGLLSTDNEEDGPIAFLAKDGVYELIRSNWSKIESTNDTGGIDGSTATDEQLDKFFNIAVIKLKSGTNIEGIANELASIYPSFDVEQTVNSEVLSQACDYLLTPFTACIYLVVAFCVLIIFLTCKLTFSERIRQFATLKSMGATTGNLLFCLLTESAFYGLIGGILSVGFCLAEIYTLPLMGINYVTPVSAWYYIGTIAFGVFIAIFSSFAQALKFSRKSIKETMITQDKFKSANFYISPYILGLSIVLCVVFLCLNNISTKWILLPIFLLIIATLVFVLPLIVSWIFELYKKIYRKPTFEHTYMKRTLPSKNLAVSNRLLFFGMFLVMLFIGIMSSLKQFAVIGWKYPFDVSVSQVSSENVSDDTFANIQNIEGVEHAWKSISMKDSKIAGETEMISVLDAYEFKEIERLYKSKIPNFEKQKEKYGTKNIVYLNKYFNDVIGIKLGQKITLSIGSTIVDTKTFTVAGFIDSYDNNYGDYAVCVLNDLQDLHGINGFNSIYIHLKDGAKAEDVISSIRSLPVWEEIAEESESLNFLTFVDGQKRTEILSKRLNTPLTLIEIYSDMVLILCLLCIFIGYILFFREATEYHKTLFILGMSPRRFGRLILRQSLFMSFITIASSLLAFAITVFNMEPIFNSLGTVFYTSVNWGKIGLYMGGMVLGTSLMAYFLGLYFRRDLLKTNKRLFG